jgi:2-dehydropantoate 2-reductase
MNIVIVGQGAIGLLWYSKLSQINEVHVRLKCSDTTRNIPVTMSFKTLSGQLHRHDIHLASKDDLLHADHIIFCLKAYDLITAIKTIAPTLSKTASIIMCHNGMVNITELSKNIQATQSILTMLITHASKREQAFAISHTGCGKTELGLAYINKGVNSQPHTELINVLEQALGNASWQDNIVEKQWIKLAINCVINPLTTLNNINNGEVLADKYRQKIKLILREVIAVAQKQGVTLELALLENTVFNVAEKTAQNSSSMRCDWLGKRKTEIDNINGFVHQQGLKHHVATPENTQLWQQITKLTNNTVDK